MGNRDPTTSRRKLYHSSFLMKIAKICLLALSAKVLVSILSEYYWYFPADFERSAFLTGRREYFFGIYGIAFYVHIVSGPLVVVSSFFLILTGGLPRFRESHVVVARLLVFAVILLLAPSGLIMSTRAATGMFAGLGFALLSVATATAVGATSFYARRRDFRQHRVWAMRSFLLLCSPLLLRLFSGTMILTQLESDFTYQMSAWTSWILPILVFEIMKTRLTPADTPKTNQLLPFSSEATQ